MATINTIPHSSIAGTPRGMDLLDTPLLNKGTAFSADAKLERWRRDYNQKRPHSALDDRTPDMRTMWRRSSQVP